MTDPICNRTYHQHAGIQHAKGALCIVLAAAALAPTGTALAQAGSQIPGVPAVGAEAPGGEVPVIQAPGAPVQERAQPGAASTAPSDPLVSGERADPLRSDPLNSNTRSPNGVGAPVSTGASAPIVVNGAPYGPAQEANVAVAPMIGATTLYGPPSPKARRGELAAIGWTDPGSQIPPALEIAVNIVTRNYPSASSARAALRASAADVRSAKWLRFPSISGNVSYLDNTGSPQPQLVVEAPIWAGGRLSANIQRAEALEESTSAQYIETVQSLALTTSQTYFEIARLTLREQLLEDSLAEHNRLVGTMERRVEQEVSPLADLELARSRSAQIEQEYTSTTAQRLTALRVLAQLVADPDYDLGPIPFYDPSVDLPSRDVLEEQAVAYNPTLDRLKAQTDVARATLAANRASILPQVNAQYSYDEVFGSRVGVVLRSQTTGGLSQLSDINSASLRIQATIENTRVAEQELRRSVASDIITYEASKKQATISTSAASTASRVSESYMRQFIAGRRSWLDVMNALREAVNAQIAKSDAQIITMATASKLLLQSGRWRPVFDEPVKK